VIKPVKQNGLSLVKTFHTTDIVYDFPMAPLVWNVVAFIDMTIPAASYPDVFKAAVDVKPLWDDQGSAPACVYRGHQTFGGAVLGVQSDPYIQTITISCPSRLNYTPAPKDAMTTPSSMISPDLLVTVNFTMLGISDDSLVDARRRTVSILVGLTDNTADVVENTIPTPLFPGSHLCGSTSRELRQRFVKPPLASSGIFSPSMSFLVSDLVALVQDPSLLVPRLENTATLRIFGQNDDSEWMVKVDYKDDSVLAGFASLGAVCCMLSLESNLCPPQGLWTVPEANIFLRHGGEIIGMSRRRQNNVTP